MRQVSKKVVKFAEGSGGGLGRTSWPLGDGTAVRQFRYVIQGSEQ